MCDLSIIIVSWNARAYLVQALASIADTAPPGLALEVIVVDNDSRDGSPEAVERDWPAVRLIRSGANLGFAKANNLGIRQCRGRLVALVNSDVTVLPDCLARLAAFLDAHPRAGMAGPEVLNPDGTRQASHWDFPSWRGALGRMLALDTLARRLAPPAPPPGGAAAPASGVDVLSGCFIVMRREALEQVGLLDEDFYIYGEDMDLCRRFHAAGWGVVLLPAARAIHAGGASSANAPVRFFLELQKANLHYWTKHHGRPGRVFFLGTTFIHHLLRLVPSVIIYLVRPSLRLTIQNKIKRSAACMKWILHPSRSAIN
jgi:GT2 family glycosyltransferase